MSRKKKPAPRPKRRKPAVRRRKNDEPVDLGSPEIASDENLPPIQLTEETVGQVVPGAGNQRGVQVPGHCEYAPDSRPLPAQAPFPAPARAGARRETVDDLPNTPQEEVIYPAEVNLPGSEPSIPPGPLVTALCLLGLILLVPAAGFVLWVLSWLPQISF